MADLDAKMPRGIEAKSVTEKDDLLRTSLLGRESSRLSATSYGYERGVEQNNNHSTPIFEVGMNIVAESYVRSTPLSCISNAYNSSQRTAPSTLGEGSVVTYESRVNPAYQKSKTLDNSS